MLGLVRSLAAGPLVRPEALVRRLAQIFRSADSAWPVAPSTLATFANRLFDAMSPGHSQSSRQTSSIVQEMTKKYQSAQASICDLEFRRIDLRPPPRIDTSKLPSEEV